ncbi:hypothetical protein Zmor_008777 [Zophobas morio]|jgi:hypothetical protein|uniref:Uncharacterized protein n=1 Tax=Zophobas morio TaxID=2755281 RepID=A0AA38HHY7_9CUCU|nr:hypothetical protein Zmor_008777 [Zophobas morio]
MGLEDVGRELMSLRSERIKIKDVKIFAQRIYNSRWNPEVKNVTELAPLKVKIKKTLSEYSLNTKLRKNIGQGHHAGVRGAIKSGIFRGNILHGNGIMCKLWWKSQLLKMLMHKELGYQQRSS